jgi:hypothetical protein
MGKTHTHINPKQMGFILLSRLETEIRRVTKDEEISYTDMLAQLTLLKRMADEVCSDFGIQSDVLKPEIIQRIYKAQNVSDHYDGFFLITNRQEIFFGIDNDQQCCENWGYLMGEEDLSYFLGAELLDIKVTDKAYNKTSISMKNIKHKGSEELYSVFIDIETSKGVFQFVAYNEQNGAYGHTVMILSNQLVYEGRV